jgi:hypothetical protein
VQCDLDTQRGDEDISMPILAAEEMVKLAICVMLADRDTACGAMKPIHTSRPCRWSSATAIREISCDK